MIPVNFYIPNHNLPVTKIDNIVDISAIDDYLIPLGTPTNLGTAYNWILQTYLRLKADGFPCSLSSIIPQEGIVIAFRGSIPFNLKPTAKLLIVCVLADGIYPHPWAQIHVVQNYQQQFIIPDSYYISHWPQPGLIPRNYKHSARFKNIAYFGDITNLAPEMRSVLWQEQVNSIGLNWCVKQPHCWNDYSNVDAIIAVRSFDKQDYIWKPATKLYNAWHAGVPAILGKESAYQAERRSELDYIEVTSIDEAITVLNLLANNYELRKRIIDNGRIRAQEISVTYLVNRWRSFITETAVPAYERWLASSYLTKSSFFMKRYLNLRMNGIKQRLRSFKI